MVQVSLPVFVLLLCVIQAAVVVNGKSGDNWLSGIAKHKNVVEVKKQIDLEIKVVDKNINPPVFRSIEVGEVKELSAIGTSVMKITATDADDPGNENSQIVYSIIGQNPPRNMFYIHADGTVYVQSNDLDREREDHYTLTVKGHDLNGRPGGNTGTGTIEIKILDENDNLPTLEKDQYEVSIEENTQNVEVMRFQAHDLDQKYTDNWIAIFQFVRGNEAGYFSFKVNSQTNEGILMLDKALDYEDVKTLDLRVALRNKAELYSAGKTAQQEMQGTTQVSWVGFKTYGIKVNVKNQPEGQIFVPKVKSIHVLEGDQNIKINQVIAKYAALDVDTMQEAQNVKYVVVSDPDNWLTFDQITAEIKLNKMPDRESTFLVDGTYFVKVLCISEDMPDTTANGTIAIQVKDSNDNCPTLTSDFQTMCTTSDSVIVNAKDEDLFPNGPPFNYVIIPEGTVGKWQVENLNDTAVILRAQEAMWHEFYDVNLLVKDVKGHHCESQKLKVRVCTCGDGVTCEESRVDRTLGPTGIGLLFLGLLLLLLFLLLIFVCECGQVFGKIPFDPKPHLINYHTEGPGENTDVPLVIRPQPVKVQYIKDVKGKADTTSFQQIICTMEETNCQDLTSVCTAGMNGAGKQDYQDHGSEFCPPFKTKKSGFGGGPYDGMSLQDDFLREYYTQKVASEIEKFEMEDNLVVYDFEGQGSSAGSVGCCSLLETDNDLQFLDDLGPKFKTLAEVCGGKKISSEVKQVLRPLPCTTINTQISVPSVVTTQQQQLTVPKAEQTVIRETSEHSQKVKDNTVTVMEGMTTMNKGMTNQGQMLLLQQQPVYYSTSPALQPMQYVVQPQALNTMLLAEAPATNLQGMVVVNGTQTGPAQGVFQGSSANLIHTGNLTGSQTMVVVEGEVPAGSVKVMKENQTSIVHGCTMPPGQLIQEAGGLSLKSDISGSQRVFYSHRRTSTGA